MQPVTGKAEHGFDGSNETKESARYSAWDAGIVLYGTFTFVSARNLAESAG